MQREINKYLKKINAAKLKNDHKECIELYNLVGGLYSDIGSYEEAIFYHEKALELCITIGNSLGTAEAYRFIGEAQAAAGNFFQAIEKVKKYLELTGRIKNKVELQRAWTTLGRVYLMQAQELKEQSNFVDDKIREISREAEKKFNMALTIAETVRDQVDSKEFAQMKGGLFLNLGLVNDICGQYKEAVMRCTKAIEIMKPAKLKEEIYRCHVILTTIYRQRNNLKLAVKESEEALAIAKSIGRKLLICEAYIERGFVKIAQRDFRGAKHAFAQAYLEKSPSEDDHSKAIRLTKIAHLIVVYYEKLSKNESAGENRMKICDKLGDLFVAINAYRLAVEYYKRAFADAKVCGKPKIELAKILYSIAETYADDGQFENALLCYEKELIYRNGNAAEQCQSLVKIAHMHEYLGKDNSKISESYEKALDRADKNPKLIYTVIRDYVAFMLKKSFNISRCKELESVMENLKSYPEVVNEIEAENCEEVNDIEDEVSNIDDIITDDEGDDEVLMVGRKRARGPTKFKPNEVGDTPLHEACIKGDLKRVKSLISQGHEVNPRDNAGWIPLHEACNHGHFDIAEYLIENGADVCNRGLKGMTPLHDAATNGHFDIMRLLMKNGANVIALTDTGETILSCLRDYKKRNYSDMSNQEMSEYRSMESELLNSMDRCGFNLMEANIKSLGTRRESSLASQALQEVRPKPRNLMSSLETDNLPQPVKDYRKTMGILKRKRLHDDEPVEVHKKVSLPATIQAEMSTSAKTKDWIIDDVSKEKQILKRRQPICDVLESSDDDNFEDEIDHRVEDTRPVDNGAHDEENQKNDRVDDIIQIEDDDFNGIEDEDLVGFDDDDEFSNSRASFSAQGSNKVKQVDLTDQPLTVQIEDRKLLIPIKNMTVRELKTSVIERYEVLSKARPIISLAPLSDPSCNYYDDDLCRDVIRESVIASIEGWRLKSLTETYLDCCEKQTVEPLTYIIAELKRIEQVGLSTLDLSYIRLPKTHVLPFAKALSYRDIHNADLTGVISLFDSQANADAMLECLATWRKLNRLNMRCIGLRASLFESFCDKMKCPELKLIDMSHNTLVYKTNCSDEFVRTIEKLRQGCPKLKRLDLRYNNLLFVKPLLESFREKTMTTAAAEAPEAENSDDKSASASLLVSLPSASAEKVDLAKIVDLAPAESGIVFELDVSDQNNFAVY